MSMLTNFTPLRLSLLLVGRKLASQRLQELQRINEIVEHLQQTCESKDEVWGRAVHGHAICQKLSASTSTPIVVQQRIQTKHKFQQSARIQACRPFGISEAGMNSGLSVFQRPQVNVGIFRQKRFCSRSCMPVWLEKPALSGIFQHNRPAHIWAPFKSADWPKGRTPYELAKKG